MESACVLSLIELSGDCDCENKALMDYAATVNSILNKSHATKFKDSGPEQYVIDSDRELEASATMKVHPNVLTCDTIVNSPLIETVTTTKYSQNVIGSNDQR